MKYFQTLFLEQHNNVIEFQGIIYHRYWPISIHNSIKMKLRFLSSSSSFSQAIVLSLPCNFDGTVSVMGKEVSVRKSAFPLLNFWKDTAPQEFELTITNFQGEIKICNGSDPIGTKQFCKHMSEGCAMIVQKVDINKYRFYCHDHEFEGPCDDLVFELEVKTD